MDSIAPADIGIRQLEYRDSRFNRAVLEPAVALFLGEKITPAGNDKAHVARACLIDSGKVDLIEDSVADCEPHLAVLVECRSYTSFGT